jgi:hypothetical protein
VRETELRPLGAGELLDRAVTLYVRSFVPIVLVVAAVVVPLTVIEALLQPHAGSTLTDVANMLSARPNSAAQRAALNALQADGGSSWASALLSLATIVAGLLEYSAVVAVIAGAYAGTRVGLRAAFSLALRLWPRQILVGLAFLVIGAIPAIPLFVIYIILVLVIVGIGVATHAQVLAIALGAIAIVLWIVVVGAVFSWVYMAYQLAAVSVVTESLSPSAAIGAGLRRAFRRPTATRSLIAGLIVSALSFIGVTPIIIIATLVATVGHLDVLYFAILGVGTIVLHGLVYVFVVVYANDVRVRREGLDLLPSTAA